MIESLVVVVHIFVCVLMVMLVLLQQGKGADVGATFGGGGSSLFGATGADNLLSRVTTGTAVVFGITSIMLAMSARPATSVEGTVFEQLPTQAEIDAAAEEKAEDEAAPAAESDASAPGNPMPKTDGTEEPAATEGSPVSSDQAAETAEETTEDVADATAAEATSAAVEGSAPTPEEVTTSGAATEEAAKSTP